ncbi:D-alanyl-D-alanine carboxypeptidase/D-alanyl-D-alanine-endopeptidase [Cognatishimia sp. F0-27]|uniref:D-alanyl-D-alanine carboxypeptidase/D-alanyl-D-alanine endopeptidase n=1 Tax=Cognatishimia sp. F0-27 TaxID=2816855 RepID=UPI001D0C609E|nr:D-alanyl-D-alanine carboxypeptidase/D-alanyl-D-alanine-endopeptidase [Cognatishimia sp. F0-27]MCC1492821.1 D-alanyl-D-alanine carboxypeptidase/D-alanyl-D-alanine-endopeptidase [Cognatishimia sp. F0-27]
MTQAIGRRVFLSGVAALALTTPALANAPLRSLKPVGRGGERPLPTPESAATIIDKARLDGQVGCAVARSADGALLESVEGAEALPPASCAKALTAAYALDALGADYRFETQLITTGVISEQGVVKGDLVLAGGGDPTLDTDGLATLARQLKAAGVTAVEGRFLVWGGSLPFSPMIDAAQPDHVGYNPAISGLNLNFNRVHFEWKRSGNGYAVTMDARSAAHRPKVRMARMAVEARSVPVYTYADRGGRDDWTVARGALGNGGARWLPVRKPELYAGEVFEAFARSQGISLKAPEVSDVAPDGVVLTRLESAPLDEILRDMLRFSTNLTAEVVGQQATRARLGRAPESLKASADAMNDWARTSLGMDRPALVDHSGLGDASRISAQDMVTGLLALKDTPLKSLMKPFPMRDSERRIIENHPLSVQAKTGTLNFVSGLAGFVDLPNGEELVFAVFSANFDRRNALSKAQRERPDGGRTWNRRAKALQQALIERWGAVYVG